jgi:hypothetical protein
MVIPIMTTPSRIDRIKTWDTHTSEHDLARIAEQTVPEYDDIGQLARCAATGLRYALAHLEKGRSTTVSAGNGHLVHIHADAYIDKYYDINGVTVGNEYGLIAAYLQILLEHIVNNPEQIKLP